MPESSELESDIFSFENNKTSDFKPANDAKADFDDIYNRTDPRAYFRTLKKYGYAIPETAKPVTRAVLRALRAMRGLTRLRLVDLGCSYGVNGALLKHEMSLRDLYEHYTAPDAAALDREELLVRDKAFLESHPPRPEIEMVGLDAAPEAVAYASEAGLIDEGVAANLEDIAPEPADAEVLGTADLVVSTGCVGYVTGTTFARILDTAVEAQPWVASFVLRMFPYDEIEAVLAERDLVTEKLEGVTFRQRAFASAEERDGVLAQLQSLEIDTEGKEALGHFHAEFFLSRPSAEVARLPLAELVNLAA